MLPSALLIMTPLIFAGVAVVIWLLVWRMEEDVEQDDHH
jgi:hypothetical protein